MPPLKSGTCASCSTANVKLRTNPFTNASQCSECRDASIIGITDIKSRFKLKEDDLEGLNMKTEAKPAFLGGPDRRWYLVEEVEGRAEEVTQARGDAKKEKEEAKNKANEDKKKEKASAASTPKTTKREKNGGKSPASASSATPNNSKRKRDGEDEEEEEEEDGVAAAPAVADPPVKRGRGRPPKAGGPKPPKKPVLNADGTKRGRGRPPKAKAAAVEKAPVDEDETE